jgi:hypothetical protein
MGMGDVTDNESSRLEGKRSYIFFEAHEKLKLSFNVSFTPRAMLISPFITIATP